MKLLITPWKTAWYDDQISEKFFQEMSRLEKGAARDLRKSSHWLGQLVIEVGQLAQNLMPLEEDHPSPSQIRFACERALKISALAAHLTAALDRADPEHSHTPVHAVEVKMASAAQQGPVALRPREHTARLHPAEGEGTTVTVAPMRQTVESLSRRGLSVAEIEVITGHSSGMIESILGNA